MKISAASLLLMFLLWAVFASATGPQGTIQHVIIVIQENRTPTNLFYADQTLAGYGAHVQPANPTCFGTPTALTGMALDAFCFDPDHSHFGPYLSWPYAESWVNQYHNGAMDGACTNHVDCTHCTSQFCTHIPSPAQYTYALSDKYLAPLFTIAETYGFANYMFQTNQGPSFPAHQFLFSGTSAPEGDPNDVSPFYHEWFVAENPEGFDRVGSTGCTAFSNTYALQLSPGAQEGYGWDGDLRTGTLPTAGYPCYDHNSLPTLLDNNNPRISWRYYSPNTNLWNAPLTNYNICLPTSGTPQTVCSNTSDYQKYVAPYTGALGPGMVLTDLGVDGLSSSVCQLQNVSWVVPDGNWSDHPGSNASNAGPSWVASIVNAVGGYDNSGNKLNVQCGYWANTVILVVWDDWGGFYDDVPPPDCSGSTCRGYSNDTGGQYVYGFRVPLLVVSAYAQQVTPGGGYISGPPTNPNCSPGNYYCHDFGSILNFTEYVFGLNSSNPSGIGPEQYPFADYLAPDAPFSCGQKCPLPYSLADFFAFTKPARTFTPISAPYDQDCFTGKENCGFTYGLDPDDDAIEQ